MEKRSCTRMFIATLFTIAKTWKSQKCTLTDDWFKKCGLYINGILLSHKEELKFSIYSNTDRSREYYT